jgi:hypothetical protein
MVSPEVPEVFRVIPRQRLGDDPGILFSCETVLILKFQGYECYLGLTPERTSLVVEPLAQPLGRSLTSSVIESDRGDHRRLRPGAQLAHSDLIARGFIQESKTNRFTMLKT